MAFSTFMGNNIIDHMLRNASFTSPSLIYASLHTADPGLTGTSEVSGSGYVRQTLWLNAASSKTTTSASVLNFTSMPACNVLWAGIWNTPTAGSFFMSGSFSASKVVNSGDTFQVAVADFDVILS